VTSALFLDRDGVINVKPPEGAYVADWEQFEFLPGVPEALAEVRSMAPEAVIVVVTNQRGIALGRMTSDAVNDIHRRMRDRLQAVGGDVDAVEVCPHETGACDCRKPALGLFERALADFPSIDPDAMVVVGDSLADIQAGFRLGARTCLVGPPSRRVQVLREAGDAAVRLDLEADSLVDLVADPRFRAWI
jgi:D-glycero-D-manno-heptose 1,7-bisphosphate phosphatase